MRIWGCGMTLVSQTDGERDEGQNGICAPMVKAEGKALNARGESRVSPPRNTDLWGS